MKTILSIFIGLVGIFCISAAGFSSSKIVKMNSTNDQLSSKLVPTYYEDISPIIYNHCTKCHRPGEIGPMPLTNIAEVSAYGAMIKYVTELKYMPPWKADPNYNHHLGENYLSDAEIQTIADWYDAGMQAGDPTNEAPMPNFPSGSALGTPDIVLSMAESFEHQGTNEDGYQVFILDPQLTQAKEVRAIEFRPGNPSICHHAVIAMDTTNQGDLLDAADPDYGYEMFGGFGFNPVDPLYAVWAPGTEARFFPPEISKVLLPNSKLLMQMHYAPIPVNDTDSSRLNIFFAQTPSPRYLQTYILSPANLPVPFVIPPNTVTTFKGSNYVPTDISLMSVFPHMHLLGKSWKSYAVDANGDTTKLVRINDWDFNYQNAYNFTNLVKITAGSTIFVEATYDNTDTNPLNPNNPPQYVFWGDFTGDEMFVGFYDFVPYQLGDEDIMLGSEELIIQKEQTDVYPIYPNPASEQVKIGFRMSDGDAATLTIFDNNGKMVELLEDATYFSKGKHLLTYNTQHLNPGMYRFIIDVNGEQKSTNFVVK
ncbi:T9SS type A sorting domain-containing protein [Crocinitomicaceae bacterium]|nr:T9SS type A sorting domain-containing protein [Crocinitomicaceae bacterium]